MTKEVIFVKGKKVLSLLCAAALTLSFAACGSRNETDYSGQTLTGEITDINGTAVTMQLGELNEIAAPSGGVQNGQTPPDKPDGEAPSGDGGGQSPTASDSSQPPELPDGQGDSSDAQPPELPGGQSENSQNSDSGNQMPDKPDGEAPSGGAPDAMGGMSSFTAGEESVTLDFADVEITKNGETVTLSDIAEGDILTVEVGSGSSVTSAAVEAVSNQGGQSFGGSGEVTQGTAATTISEDGTYSGITYTSTGDDENALRVDGATVTLDGVTVDKSAGVTSNTEDGDFYGMNAALLATNGATVTIKNATVTSSAQNGNGVFSYGSGTTVNISDSTITTTADNSGGIQTTGGGTTNASNLIVETSGNSSAAIRSDRGGGTVNVDGGAYTSNGYNSPAVYSTADIIVKNANLTANNSEVLVIEGKNSITLENCYVIGNMSDDKGTSSDENVHNVMIYQSMSGDADVGTSVFSMTGGSLVSNNGDMFYITNTHCLLTLSDVNIVNNDETGALLRVVGNSANHGWGTAGSNGAQVEFTADGQKLDGDIIVDTISTLTMTMKNGSTFTGAINIIDNAEGGAAVSDNAIVTIESGCTWNLTGNCTLTSLTNNGTINFNGYTITLADGTVLK